MREEYELEVLEKYDIEVKGTRRIRGAFFCDTNEGTMLLKETKMSARRASLLYSVLSRLEKRQGLRVDTPVFAGDGELLVTSADGTVYMLKRWFQGRECDIRQDAEVERAAGKLGILHRETGSRELWEPEEGGAGIGAGGTARDPEEEIRRHNRELKKVRSFIRGRTVKNEFESIFLENFENMYRTAELVLERMQDSGCGRLFRDSIRDGCLVHGDYNYHNLLVIREDMAVTGFEHIHVDVQADDLYYFMRKVMEKHRWKRNTGQRLIEAYEEERKLHPAELEYIGLCLAYPEKFWKTASSYYHSNKAWIPEKSVEKLKLAVRQNEEKYGFLEDLFSLRF